MRDLKKLLDLSALNRMAREAVDLRQPTPESLAAVWDAPPPAPTDYILDKARSDALLAASPPIRIRIPRALIAKTLGLPR